MSQTRTTIPGGLGIWIAAMTLWSAPARAQSTDVYVPETNQRSGAVTRYVPRVRDLPPDPYRENYYDTAWNRRQTFIFPNNMLHGGIYGVPWRADCTLCNATNFRGLPGPGTVGPHCSYTHPVARIWSNFVHPFKPACAYYDGGCYSPVYDLDPLVTGPGPFPWPFLFKDMHKWRPFIDN